MSVSDSLKFEVVKKIAETGFKIKELGDITNIDSNSPPSIFIGSGLKYPLVNVGILSPLERDDNAWLYDDAKYWANNDFKIGEVVKLRDSLLNSRFKSKVTDVRVNNKFLEIAKEIAMSSKSVDIEIELKQRVRFDKNKDKVITPQGLNAPLKNARITENIKIDQKIDKVVNDEIKASQGIKYLYKNNFSEYVLSKILSVGVLGLKKDKKLVPTRWCITATDDMISKDVLSRIKDNKWIDEHELYFGEFMGNQYMVLLFPGVWSYELFELYYPGSSWNPSSELKASTDLENYDGRKSYAFNTGGGYYATRLPIVEYLDKIKRQASVIVIRLETPSYWASLGVWVVRESVRKALSNRVMKFSSREEMLESVKKIALIKYNFDSDIVLKKSKLLSQVKTQTNLGKWF
jgi:hypothetical protein